MPSLGEFETRYCKGKVRYLLVKYITSSNSLSSDFNNASAMVIINPAFRQY